MIFINNGGINKLVMTGSQDTLLTGLTHTYLLKLYSDQNNSVTYTLTDVSFYPDRYNEFYLTGSTVHQPTGYYNYTLENTTYPTTILEIGKCVIYGQKSVIYTDVQTDKITKYVDTRN